jgi:transcriptional regulator with XRE-family HTH domain
VAAEEWAEVGERVREARTASGLSQTALAAKLGLDRTAVVRIEAGQRQVSAVELFRLADLLSVPPAYFLSRPRQVVTSRRGPLTDGADEPSRVAWRADVALDAHVRDVEWMVRHGRLPSATGGLVPRPAGTVGEAAERARAARARLDVPSGPLGPLADACEAFGLFLLVIDQDIEGVSVLLDAGATPIGAAVMGGLAPPGRRRWTAAHELGHHLLADEYHSDVGVSASRDERERVVDAFAGELLLPAADLEREFADAGDLARDQRRDLLVRIAGTYRMSWGAVVERARTTGVLPAADCRELRADTPLRGDFVRILGYEPAKDLAVGTTGGGWRRAVLAYYHDGLISGARAVELLHGALSEQDLPARSDETPP